MTELVLSFFRSALHYYTGWNIVRKVTKMLQHLFRTKVEYWMSIAFIWVPLQRRNDQRE